MRPVLVVLGYMWIATAPCAGGEGHDPEEAQEAIAMAVHGILADYDSELRREDGRVDVEAMTARLKDLGVNTYFWLIWHASTDWDDLKLFLPRAAAAKINVWVYLVPPSESPPRCKWYSEPFRLDYHRWGEEIARLSLEHKNLTAWVIDDFYANRRFYTPAYIREMQRRAKAVNPRLPFLPLMYFPEINRRFIDDYREVIDGVVVAYPRDAQAIATARAFLNDEIAALPGQLSYPWATPSRPGDFAAIRQTAAVLPAPRYVVRFDEQDDFTAATAGYHFKQLLVGDAVVWERDVAGGAAGWQKVEVDVTKHIKGKRQVSVAFRLFDKKGVSNFGVRWSLRDLEVEGLRLEASLDKPEQWQVSRHGAFEAGFGDAAKRKGPRRQFHIPFIVMPAGCVSQFRKRHPGTATPERVVGQLGMCLEQWRAGRCDGVVTYCLDKSPQSPTFPPARELFLDYRERARP